MAFFYLQEDGGHVCPWWLYGCVTMAAPRSSELQFGATTHQTVNATPHMWVRGKAAYLEKGARLLRGACV